MKEKVNKLSELYEENFQRMIRAVGTPEHKKYVKIERALERQSIAQLKKKGFSMGNPCPTASNRPCKECTGRYKLKEYTTPGGNSRSRFVMSDKGEKCNLK